MNMYCPINNHNRCHQEGNLDSWKTKLPLQVAVMTWPGPLAIVSICCLIIPHSLWHQEVLAAQREGE